MMNHDFDMRLEHLEAEAQRLRIENRVLASALKSLLRVLPADLAANTYEEIQLGFEDELARLNYQENTPDDLFYDAIHTFFGERE